MQSWIIQTLNEVAYGMLLFLLSVGIMGMISRLTARMESEVVTRSGKYQGMGSERTKHAS